MSVVKKPKKENLIKALSLYLLDVVLFAPDTDGVTALYINGKLHSHGDYYHNKMNDWLVGFLDGLKFAKVDFAVEYHEIPYEKCQTIVDNGNKPPQNWPNKFTKHET